VAGRAVGILAVCILLSAGQARAVTTLEGYSSFMTELRSSGGGDPTWQFSNPQLYAELRVKTSPWKNIDSFLKMAGESNRWYGTPQAKDTRVFFKEAHVHFRAERVEAYIFSGQNRFWLNEPLLEIVNQDVVKQDSYGPRAQGVRVDFWNVYGVYGAAFLSEKNDYQSKLFEQIPTSEQQYYPGYTPGDTVMLSTDDYRAFRLNRSFAENRALVGATYARKDYTRYDLGMYHSRTEDFDEVIATDAEFALGEIVPPLSRFGRMTLVTEVGRNTSGWLWSTENPAPSAFKTELRETKVGPLKFVGAYETYGEDFYRSGLASGDKQNLNDYRVMYGEARYRVPTKAVNLRGWRRHAEPKHPGLTSYSNTVGTADEWGTGAYIEFVNGFTGTVEYKLYEDRNGTWPNLFCEVTGENKLVKLRTQFRIKDIDSPFEVTAYGFEANVNLSDSWKFYSRVMNVDEKTQSRQTAFAQLRYLGWQGGEFFVEFGNPDQSNDIVNDNDFVGHDMTATTEKVFKAFVRIYY